MLGLFGLVGTANAGFQIVILQSDNFQEYQTPAKAFIKELGRSARVYSIRGSKLLKSPPNSRIAHHHLSLHSEPGCIYRTPGDAKCPPNFTPGTESKRYGIEGHNVVGISMEPPLDLVLSQSSCLCQMQKIYLSQ